MRQFFNLLVIGLGFAAFLAVIIPIAEADRARSDARLASEKAEILAIVRTAPEPMSVRDICDMTTNTTKYGKLSHKHVGWILARYSEAGLLRREVVRLDGSPARWYDGASNTKAVYSAK